VGLILVGLSCWAGWSVWLAGFENWGRGRKEKVVCGLCMIYVYAAAWLCFVLFCSSVVL
jgi:hypothetical protein